MRAYFAIALTICCSCGGSALNSGGSDAGASDATVIVCKVDGNATGPAGVDPRVVVVISGVNGTFRSHCDDGGNLADFSCEAELQCGPGVNPECVDTETGNVLASTVDCAGHCRDDACDSRCPLTADQLLYVSVDPLGGAVIDNVTQSRRYDCALIFDNTMDSYDCTTSLRAGIQATVNGVGLHGNYCTGAAFGNLAVSLDTTQSENCAYDCDIAP
jgi:hypothetical protein